MWIALSMIALFVAYCWYDSFSASLLQGSASSDVSDDDTEWRREMMNFLDESLETKREDYQGWHDMDCMTPYHSLPTAGADQASHL